jgi:AcrR family transcriptional regulator
LIHLLGHDHCFDTSDVRPQQRAKVSKLSIYRHFENKEALFSAAIADRCRQFAPQVLFEGVDGSAEVQLMAVGSSLLRTLGDLVQCRRLKTIFHKEFVRGVHYRLAKRLVGGPAAPALAIFGHGNSST